MANEFKVKNGIKFPDGTVQTTASTGSGSSSSLISISDTPPTITSSGQLWWNSSDGLLYIYYNDGSSAQWVSAHGALSVATGSGAGVSTGFEQHFLLMGA